MPQTTNHYPAIRIGGAQLVGPATDGTNGQALLTDGAGTLSFGDVAAGGGDGFLDGGNAESTYTAGQVIDGGDAT